MSAALRDCFIKLHSRDLLGELKSGFQERYAGYVVKKPSRRVEPTDLSTASHATSYIAAQMSQVSSASGQALREGEEQALEQSQSPVIMNVDTIAAEYGMTALPPLAIARDERLLKELKERENQAGLAEKSEEQMEAEEEKMFVIDEGHESVEEQAENDAHGGVLLEESDHSTEVDASTTEKTAAKKSGRKAKSAKATLPKRKYNKSGKMEVFDLAKAIPDVPPRGDFDLEIIRDSPYFFS